MAAAGMRGYVAVLRVPGAFAFSAPATIVRLGQAMLGLGEVLLLVQSGRSYAAAGLVAGAISIAQGVVGPQLSRLVDARGQRAVVRPQVLVFAVAVSGLVAVSLTGVPTWLLVGAALVAGASLPQVGALARARWTALLHDPSQLERALAVESLVEEAVFVVGPVLVTFLTTVVAPAAGGLTALGLVVLGTGLFLAQRRTEPPRHRPGPAVTPGPGESTASPRPGFALPRAGLLLLVGAFAAVGALFGLVEVGVVALSRQEGAPGAAGTMLGLWAAGSLAAGTLYGAKTWRTSPVIRFRVSAVAMAAGAALIALAAESGSLVATTVALIVAGTANAPTLITGNTLVPLVVPASNLTEAYTWLGVSVFAGVAAGSAIGGVLIDHHGSGAALWAAVGAAALVGGLPLIGGARLTRR